eukprot:4214609-Prymnesium_polylepis.1
MYVVTPDTCDVNSPLHERAVITLLTSPHNARCPFPLPQHWLSLPQHSLSLATSRVITARLQPPLSCDYLLGLAENDCRIRRCKARLAGHDRTKRVNKRQAQKAKLGRRSAHRSGHAARAVPRRTLPHDSVNESIFHACRTDLRYHAALAAAGLAWWRAPSPFQGGP